MRVVLDEDVDRGQVHRRRRHSRALLIARSLSARRVFFRLHGPRPVAAALCAPLPCMLLLSKMSIDIPGGYGGGVPPLPIPNREVKPARADGTAHPWESR